MTSLQGLLPPPGSSNWRKSRSYTDSDEETITVRHVVIREVWVEKRPWPHAVYKIDVLSQTSHWFVFKRYKEFYHLHQKLIKHYGVPKDLLPPRKLTNNMARENLESRREALEHYLQKLLNSCNGSVRQSEEICEFLDVQSHDVVHVTYNLATYLQKNGQSILMSKEMFHLSPSQLYCITKQLQLPHPSGRNSVDLGVLYEFIAELKKLSITDFISQMSNGEQHEIAFTFDLGMFTSLRQLQVDAINIESLKGVECLRAKLRKITARYCLTSMKSLLIDAALEKRSAPQVNLSAHNWRVQAAYRLADNRVILQPWLSLTHVNFSHNNITTFDSSMSLLPVLRQLDLSHNQINHLDLQLLTSPCLTSLSLASNAIYLISATDKPVDNLKNLNLSHNKIQSLEGLLCCQGLEELNVTYNNIAIIGEVKVLASLPHIASLLVDGNHFAKKRRHRIIIFAYFRDKELILDKKSITHKEKAKLDAKFAALERFQDIDDSLSSISTVSEDSTNDSGIDHTNWVSKLASLSEIEEGDFEVVSKLSCDCMHAGCSESGSTSSSSDNLHENDCNEENLTREDWDRILQSNTRTLLLPAGSSPSERTIRANSRHDTLQNETNDESSTRAHLSITQRRIHSKQGKESSIQRANATKRNLASQVVQLPEKEPSQPTSRSWLSNFFRKSRSSRDDSASFLSTCEGEKMGEVGNESAQCAALVVIEEIGEYKAEENNVSRSFDDNCDFERAIECSEDEGNSLHHSLDGD